MPTPLLIALPGEHHNLKYVSTLGRSSTYPRPCFAIDELRLDSSSGSELLWRCLNKDLRFPRTVALYNTVDSYSRPFAAAEKRSSPLNVPMRRFIDASLDRLGRILWSRRWR